MDPAELRHVIDRSREIHVALHNEKKRTEPEEAVYRFARTSVVADRDLPKGHEIKDEDIWGRRPGSGGDLWPGLRQGRGQATKAVGCEKFTAEVVGP